MYIYIPNIHIAMSGPGRVADMAARRKRGNLAQPSRRCWLPLACPIDMENDHAHMYFTHAKLRACYSPPYIAIHQSSLSIHVHTYISSLNASVLLKKLACPASWVASLRGLLRKSPTKDFFEIPDVSAASCCLHQW